MSPGAKNAPKKRMRTSTQNPQDGDHTAGYEWRWGPRAHSEIGESGIALFAAEFMVERAREAAGLGAANATVAGADSEGTSKPDKASLKQAVGRIVDGIGRAAGGDLSDIK